MMVGAALRRDCFGGVSKRHSRCGGKSRAAMSFVKSDSSNSQTLYFQILLLIAALDFPLGFGINALLQSLCSPLARELQRRCKSIAVSIGFISPAFHTVVLSGTNEYFFGRLQLELSILFGHSIEPS